MSERSKKARSPIQSFWSALTFISFMICWNSVPMTPPSRSRLISIVSVCVCAWLPECRPICAALNPAAVVSPSKNLRHPRADTMNKLRQLFSLKNLFSTIHSAITNWKWPPLYCRMNIEWNRLMMTMNSLNWNTLFADSWRDWESMRPQIIIVYENIYICDKIVVRPACSMCLSNIQPT